MTRTVIALAGTDHHPFDRLVDWMDEAALRRRDVRFVVQHGATRAPRVAEGRDFIPFDELGPLLSQAALVVCHGGPGTITDAREAGHVPVCVPRDPALGEHVDGHQQRFAAMAAEQGLVRLPGSEQAFHTLVVTSLIPRPRREAASPITRERDDARARLAVELDELIRRGPARRRLARAGA